MIERTDAVVLRSLNYGETSQIVTLLTRERGLVTVMAKGARVTKSRFGSTLQPMSYIQAVYYYKASRDLQTLSETTHLRVFHGVARDLSKLAVGLRVVELTRALAAREEPNVRLFNLVVRTLEHLDAAEARPGNVLLHFELRLATLLGFAPSIDREDVQALPDEGGLLALDTGAVLPLGAHPTAARRASRSALRAYAVFARADLDTALRMDMAASVRAETSRLISEFLRYHVEDAYPSRSEHVFGQLLHPFEPTDDVGGEPENGR